MKIIMLAGEHETGKTTTFHVLYDRLTNGMSDKPEKEKIRKKSPRDFKCSLTYRGKKIVLFSLGDILYLIIDTIEKYKNTDYILIIACSTTGPVFKRFVESVRTNSLYYVIDKKSSVKEEDRQRNNEEYCQRIIDKL